MSNLGDVERTTDTYPHGYVAKLVHELRTPLTALRGSLGLLASVVDDASPDVQNFATIAERNASRLASMLDDLAELERIRGGSLDTKVEPVDLPDLIDTVVHGGQALADKASVGIDIVTEIEQVSASPALLKKLVSRVLHYAVQMSPPGTSVTVRARHDGGTAVIEIGDRGKTIKPEHRDEMFKPFSIVARRSEDASARPGLGLAIAHALASLIGATLTFTPQPDGGLFTIEIKNKDQGPETRDR